MSRRFLAASLLVMLTACNPQFHFEPWADQYFCPEMFEKKLPDQEMKKTGAISLAGHGDSNKCDVLFTSHPPVDCDGTVIGGIYE